MGTQTPNPGGRPNETAPGKPGSRQPPEVNTGIDKDREEGQEIPKTGRDEDAPEDDAGDDDELGNIELPGDGDEGARPAGNP